MHFLLSSLHPFRPWRLKRDSPRRRTGYWPSMSVRDPTTVSRRLITSRNPLKRRWKPTAWSAPGIWTRWQNSLPSELLDCLWKFSVWRKCSRIWTRWHIFLQSESPTNTDLSLEPKGSQLFLIAATEGRRYFKNMLLRATDTLFFYTYCAFKSILRAK